MTQDVRQKYIQFFRSNGFNCFPIPVNQKIADWHYKAESTTPNQEIRGDENYGYIPIRGTGTCIIDLDDKEQYRTFAEWMIQKGYMVVETGRGWQIPVTGLAGEPAKVELFDYNKQKDKIIEIQGPKQYCVGPGSEIFHDKLLRQVTYENRGTDVIWDARGKDFHEFVDELCQQCKVTGGKNNASTHANLRKKFLEGKPPGKKQSNDYFFQAPLAANTEGWTKEEAEKKIQEVYDLWCESKAFSGRPWSNIQKKIDEVYDNDYKVQQGGNRKKKDGPLEIANKIIEEYNLYSDGETRQLYVTENGFLENVTNTMKKVITRDFETGRGDTDEVMHFLIGKSPDLPLLSYDYVMFNNGMYDLKNNIITEKDPDVICAVGFKDYDYLENPECPGFIKLIEEHVRPDCKENLLAHLSNVVTPKKEIRMGVLFGPPGTGKTTLAETLTYSLEGFGVEMKVDDYFGDRSSEASVKGKTLLYFQDTPKTWKDWSKIKVTTGESKLSVRDMYAKRETIRNMLSVIISTNFLIEIDEDEEAPMFDRLTLVFFENKVRGTPNEIDNYSEKLAESEGEAIVSYCLNLRKENHKFDSSDSIKLQWNSIIKPEEIMFEKHFDHNEEAYEGKDHDGISVFEVEKKLKKLYPDKKFNIKKLQKVIFNKGFAKKGEKYLNLAFKEPKTRQTTVAEN